jgi:predicted metal-dependent phosphoesterase TrpH
MTQRHAFLGAYAPDMKLADMHVHTKRSDGTMSVERAIHTALRRGLSGLVLADHDDIHSGYAAREYCAQHNLPLEVIPCSEVSTKTAHLFAFDIEDDIRPRLTLSRTVDEIVRHGGWVGVPHPGSKLTASVPFPEILAMAQAGLPVAVEVFNASVEDLRLIARRRGLPNSNLQAQAFYEEHRDLLGPAIAGTDAHYRTLGRGAIAYRGDLRTALREREITVTYTTEWERLTPWDLALHWYRLRLLKERRAVLVAEGMNSIPAQDVAIPVPHGSD